MRHKGKMVISWEKFDEGCKKLREMLKKEKFLFFYGVPKGGLPVSVKLCNLMKKELILNLDSINYSEAVVVDDICDKGDTFKKYKKYRTACLFKRYNSKFEPDYFVWEVTDNRWLIFPWEV